jgi:hypothetical protein
MVATAAQIAANRANALLSTGPRSPEGKAASSRNALSHGAYAADDTILATAPGAYLDDFRAHFQPVGVLEEHLVAHLAVLASRRDRLAAALDALLELNERHALTEHLHERYGINADNAYIHGQPSWQAALRRYDGNTYIDDRYPEPASDPDLDPDPILCSLAYTLSGPRAAALFRHEASVDRRFSTTLKELATLQDRRRAAALAATVPPTPPAPLFEPTLQRALDRYLRDTSAAPSDPSPEPPSPAPAPTAGTGTPTAGECAPGVVAGDQAVTPDLAAALTSAPSTTPLPQPPDQTQLQASRLAPQAPDARHEANWLEDLLLDDEPTGFLSVLPRHPTERSSIPAHASDPLPSAQPYGRIKANNRADTIVAGHRTPGLPGAVRRARK